MRNVFLVLIILVLMLVGCSGEDNFTYGTITKIHQRQLLIEPPQIFITIEWEGSEESFIYLYEEEYLGFIEEGTCVRTKDFELILPCEEGENNK